MPTKTRRKRFVVTSTWGQHHVLAHNEYEAEEAAEDQLRVQGYPDPYVMINDGMTEEYSRDYHGEWVG
jgi:hypothetical protein